MFRFILPYPEFVSSIARRSSWLQSRTSYINLRSSFNDIVITSFYIGYIAHMKIENEVEKMWKVLWPNMRYSPVEMW